MIVIIIGAVLLLGGLAVGVRSARTLSRSTITVGKVVDLIASHTRKGGTIYKVKATFTDQHQQPRIYLSTWATSNPGYRVGEPIRIYYAPDDPQSSGIASFGYAFGFATILFAMGLAFLLVGGGYWFGGDLMERYFPVTAQGVGQVR